MANFKAEFYAKSLLRKYQVNVVIPSLNLQGTLSNKNENYYQDRKHRNFPLIIFLCGFGDNEQSWLTNTPVVELLEKHGVAACFINGENKWYLNLGDIDRWYDLLEKDLTDFLYGNFANLSKEAPLIIAGVSMGGYGAQYHYLKNTDKYDACIALSPALHPDHMDYSKYGTLEELYLANKGNKLNMYLSVGEKDFIIDTVKEFDEFLTKENIGVNYHYVPDEPHAWCLRRKEIFNAFDYLQKLGLID